MTSALIAPLPDGPVDVIGDVHGERALLDALLGVLGYDAEGVHPEGRQLVFVGDLVDRGPDSPGVVARVMHLCRIGRARCVLGNHELNIALGLRREGNGWFFDDPDEGGRFDARPVPACDRAATLDFFLSLPLALERPGVRVVHAAWHDAHVEALRASTGGWREVYAQADAATDAALLARGVDPERVRALEGEHGVRDREGAPPFVEALMLNDLLRQMQNPVRVLVSGYEAPAPAPFWAAGRWRMVQRVPWWRGHDGGGEATLVGHYWRSLDPARFNYEALQARPGEPPAGSLFEGVGPLDWLGPRRDVFCLDYCAGALWRERRRGQAPLHGRLAALRVPEWALITHDGAVRSIRPPG